MISVAKYIPNFKYDPVLGSFKTWLLKITRWRIIDQSRKRSPAGGPSPRIDGQGAGVIEIEQVADPGGQPLEEVWEAEWEANLLQAAIAKAKRRLNPLCYQLFDFYVNQEWPPKKVAAQFGVPVQQVYLAKHRATAMIKEEVRRLEKEVT
jgi:RNA polymerase sigma-70 factor (ECF subfamily)